MDSERYKLLSKRITELRRYLLPIKFDATGTYSLRVHERTRAFRLLAHAEFEAYIEDRVSETANRHYAEWKDKRRVTRAILGMLAYHEGVTANNLPTSILQPPVAKKKSPLLEERVEKAKNVLVTHAKMRNNGVKEENLLRLLMPLGVESDEFNATWLSSITSWSTTRGEYAHASGIKTKTLPDPQDELRSAKEILAGFREVDKILGGL